MANKYLNDTGLQYFFNKLKTLFMTNVSYDSTNKKITKTTNGTSSDVVTLSTLKTDMALNNVANGAEVNQNAFSNVKVGTTTVAADSKTDTFELVAGDNVTLTPDTTNDKITIDATDTVIDPATANPVMDGTAAVGTSDKYAREDHKHPSDTSRVPTTRKVNGHALSGDVTVTNADLGQVYGTCSTAAATTAKVVSFTGYLLTVGGVVSIKFSYAVPASATLNINSKGAKPIYYNGAAIKAGIINQNDLATFMYDGSYYHLIAVNGTSHGIVTVSGDPPTRHVTVTDGSSSVELVNGIKINDGSKLTPTNGVISFDMPVASYAALEDVAAMKVVAGETTMYAPVLDTSTGLLPNGYLDIDNALSSSSVKPVQNKVINTALGNKANLASPTFTGTPTAPTATAGTNTTQIATTAFVKTAVDNALDGITGIEYQVVESLPATGAKGVIYLIAHAHGTGDAYDEYIWTGSAFEKIGNTDVDLSGYMKTTDMVAITTSEIDTLFA